MRNIIFWIILSVFINGFAIAGELPKGIVSEVKNQKEVPKGSFTLAGVYPSAGKSAGHQAGRQKPDPEAGNKLAWVAIADEDTPDKCILFGPYVDLQPGKYVAFFRIKVFEKMVEEEIVGTIDACVGYGATVLQTGELTDENLKEEKYAQAPLVFDYPGGKLECRMYWPGVFSVAIDCVTLFKIE